jgi:Tfp pilus assembly protein PilO
LATSTTVDKISQVLGKVPWTMVQGAFLIYTAYDLINFKGDVPMMPNPQSPLYQKKQEVENAAKENQKLRDKEKEMKEFVKNLSLQKDKIRQLASSLKDMKATLPETLDEAELTKTLYTEAKKVGLVVVGLKPLEETKRDFYAEQVFEFEFRGIFAQSMMFLERLTSLQKIIKSQSLYLKPISSQSDRFVELKGTVKVVAFSYLRSTADDLPRKDQPK